MNSAYILYKKIIFTPNFIDLIRFIILESMVINFLYVLFSLVKIMQTSFKNVINRLEDRTTQIIESFILMIVLMTELWRLLFNISETNLI